VEKLAEKKRRGSREAGAGAEKLAKKQASREDESR
jgi:hypothetical protein